VVRSTLARTSRFRVSGIVIGSLLAGGCRIAPSPRAGPEIRFVTVQPGVRLEVIDWGGAGRAVVLLAGGGNTAHVYDEFAPKLTRMHHVYGITRRGFGASGWSIPERADERLRDDVLAVADSLHLDRPVLVGHSFAGAEMSAVANLRPDRIAGLIYLDAAYPYAFDNGMGVTMQEFAGVRGLAPPTPRDSDMASFDALQHWDARTFGFRTPATEFRQTWDSTSSGRPLKPRVAPGSALFPLMLTRPKRYAEIPVPALILFAYPHAPEAWMVESADSTLRARADAYFKTMNELTARQARAVEGVPNVRVVRLRGAHYLFASNERDVLVEIRSFIDRLH
jgi:pimeloyl-ACP methyl ester carboxylesterase